jgi:preprotein translocase subunit SecF
MALSLGIIIFSGLSFGIDFTGGSLIEIEYTNTRPETSLVREKIESLNVGEFVLQPTGEKGFILRTKELQPSQKEVVMNAFSLDENQTFTEKRFNSVGPVIGNELKNKAYTAIIVVILAIVLFITFAFRKVSKPVSSWKYGLVAILSLIHDVLVPTGFYVLLGIFVGVEIDILFVTAILAILGFSVHDTIVVFDRVRENLRLNQEFGKKEEFSDTVGRSLDQAFARSINTSLTTLLVLLALFFWGGESTKYFSLTLVVGILAGVYSSLFMASPLLIVLNKNKSI